MSSCIGSVRQNVYASTLSIWVLFGALVPSTDLGKGKQKQSLDCFISLPFVIAQKAFGGAVGL